MSFYCIEGLPSSLDLSSFLEMLQEVNLDFDNTTKPPIGARSIPPRSVQSSFVSLPGSFFSTLPITYHEYSLHVLVLACNVFHSFANPVTTVRAIRDRRGGKRSKEEQQQLLQKQQHRTSLCSSMRTHI